MTEPSPVRPSWLGETITLLRSCWRPLLVIGVVTELAGLLVVGILPLTVLAGGGGMLLQLDMPVQLALIYALPAVLTGMFNAWAWAAAVRVFRDAGQGQPVRTGAALRRGLRESGRLALWLIGFGLLRAAGSVYLFYALLNGYRTVGYQTASVAMVAGGWYLTFATALLPLVVLFERRGPVRAWWLAHSRAATVGQIVAVLAFGLAVDNVADHALVRLLAPGGEYSWPVGVRVAKDSALGIATSAVTTTALAVAYLRRAGLPVSPAAQPAPEAFEPVVIDLGRVR
ncbi:hypothetical protein [Catellatospora citrea]|uniref:Uncharacterized protein n=1 Tax=Catellatospora citrea TaxID=53366 RepID=A0A8J3P2N6_9ACTN|nr:hypothetical protein [Catellatospora citrea]RKE08557.1 hypothetical protein C8E86_3409 [Catellatospora citrea]GIG01714.1 hypothetical protein Cci01nite_68070 [Catellatospora citrea]